MATGKRKFRFKNELVSLDSTSVDFVRQHLRFLAVGGFAINAMRAWRSPALPWLASIRLDPYVFGFTMVVAGAAASLFGAAPAITSSRANLMGALKTTSLRMSGVRDHRLLRNTLEWLEKSRWLWYYWLAPDC